MNTVVAAKVEASYGPSRRSAAASQFLRPCFNKAVFAVKDSSNKTMPTSSIALSEANYMKIKTGPAIVQYLRERHILIGGKSFPLQKKGISHVR